MLMKTKRRNFPYLPSARFKDGPGGEKRRVQREQEASAEHKEDPGGIDEESKGVEGWVEAREECKNERKEYNSLSKYTYFKSWGGRA